MNASVVCPVSTVRSAHVLISHGGGGRMMHQLLETVFLAEFDGPHLAQRHDGAVVDALAGRLAFTTDSYVVRPLFFPGGNIGTLAVNGTANDLAMCGARPQWLSAAFILEEGLPVADLARVVRTMRESAAAVGVELVTGDTKVVERGRCDGLYVTTSGVGVVEYGGGLSAARVECGDAVLINGDLGRHGVAVMSVREGLEFETTIESDCAALWPLVEEWIREGVEIHCLRDLTRGGLASALNEIAQGAQLHVEVDENRIPVEPQIQGACEILGLDPLYVANEGRFVASVAASDAERALALLKHHPLGRGAAIVGTVLSDAPGLVTIRSAIGSARILDMLSGEQLPRIC